MKSPNHIVVALLLAALGGAASAQEMTRAQVEADLSAAQRDGDMLAPGRLGLTQRQLRPDLYPSMPLEGKTREQVKAELAAAQRNGDLLQANGLRDRDLTPGLYPADPVVVGKTREQVKAELAVAERDGDMLAPGSSGLTENQLEPQFFARQRAIDDETRLHSAAD